MAQIGIPTEEATKAVEDISRFYVEIIEMRSSEVVFGIGRIYGGDADLGKPFWTNRGRPRVVAIIKGHRFEPGPEWKEYRIPLLEFFMETAEGYPAEMYGHARAEIARVLREGKKP